MIAAGTPAQRPPRAKLLVANRDGRVRHLPRAELIDVFEVGDLVIANDAATLPASLKGVHLQSGGEIEVRLAAHDSRAPNRARCFTAVLFGSGDFRMRTEDRPLPPAVFAGDQLIFGTLTATVTRLLHSPRLVELRFEGRPGQFWEGIARSGRPVQYAHVAAPLAVWDTWTAVAGPPVAFEPPSAGFALDWNLLAQMKRRGIQFATLTHAAGLSSTGDPQLDALLPFDEPYRIPAATARAIGKARATRGRIIAIGTTVVRALEHAANPDGEVPAGEGIATQRITAQTRLRVVDAILSGTHEPGASHYDLLRAFAPEPLLQRIDKELNAHDYRTHEFGDSVFLERAPALAGLLSKEQQVSTGRRAAVRPKPESAVTRCWHAA